MQLLSAISRDLISDMQAFAKASVRHMALLSAISRDLISDSRRESNESSRRVTIRYFAGPDLRRACKKVHA